MSDDERWSQLIIRAQIPETARKPGGTGEVRELRELFDWTKQWLSHSVRNQEGSLILTDGRISNFDSFIDE